MTFSILIDPDELKEGSLLPLLPNSFPCAGLEALTGADFAIKELPLPIEENTLQAHIAAGTIFVQRKSGYDFVGDFEQAFREIARMQACNIPMQQAFILAIGQFYPDDNGLLRIKGKKPLKNNKRLTYNTFLALEAEYRFCGVQVVRLNDESEIQTWIEAITRERQTIRDRGNLKELYASPKVKLEEISIGSNIFQGVIEVKPHDIRYFFNSGLKNFGQVVANSLMRYAAEKGVASYGFHAIKLLTDEDDQGKAIHKIPNWGKVSRKKFRDILYLEKGSNLTVKDISRSENEAYNKGWRMFSTIFTKRLEEAKEEKRTVADLEKLLDDMRNEIFEF